MRKRLGRINNYYVEGKTLSGDVYYNGSGSSMTFEEHGNIHLIYSRPLSEKEAQLVYNTYCK